MSSRRVLGLLLVLVSVALLLPYVVMISAPIIGFLFFHESYAHSSDFLTKAEGWLESMLGGAGLVGGIWIMRGAAKSN